MKALLLFIFLLSFPSIGINTISRLNQHTADAVESYRQKDYIKAIASYEYVLNGLGIQDDQLRLNLAHAYFRANQFKQAQEQYILLAEHQSVHIRSIVYLQLGNIAALNKKYKHALNLYKKSLVAEPAGETARYNFELLKKYLQLHPEKAELDPNDEQMPDNPLPPPADEVMQPKQNLDESGTKEAEVDIKEPDNEGKKQDQQDQGSQDKEEKQQEQDSGNTKGDSKGMNLDGDINLEEPQKQQGSSQNISESDVRARTHRERLDKANLSPEKAKILLDALRNSELQYIQQLPKKATNKPKKGQPDW